VHGSEQTERDKTSEEQSQEHAHLFLDIEGIVDKEFVLVDQTVNSEYYCDVYDDYVKM
jgi:hypothetical protein